MGLNPKKLGTDEHVILHLRTHVKALFGPILILLLDAIIVGVGVALVTNWVENETARMWAYIGLAVLFVVVLLAFVLRPWLRWLTTTYTFTNRRIITQQGILNRSGHDLPLTRINDVSYDKSLTDRMFGCGTLRLTTAAEDPVVLDDIPNIEQVHVTMSDLLFSDQIGQQPYGQQPYAQPYGNRHDD